MRSLARATIAVSLLTTSALLAPVVSLPTAHAERPETNSRTEHVVLERGRVDASGAPGKDQRDHQHDDEGQGGHELTEADLELASPPIDAGDAVLLGARWSGDSVVEVRTRKDGSWSPWLRLHRDTEEHVPDGESEELADVDPLVSEPVWTGEVDRIQFRSTSAQDLTAMYVDSVGGDVSWQPGAGGPPSRADADPRVLRRADWGADESLRDGRVGYSSSGTVRFSVVHHEGASPSWTRSEIRNGCAKADDKINAIYQYHTRNRGYWDIAYNFIVDPCGRIWEGRAGGIDRPVNGAHAGGFNDGSVGVLALGTFSDGASDPITSAMLTGIQEVLGYKLYRGGSSPHERTRETSGGGSTARWPAGTDVSLPVLSAHQISNKTSCPGGELMSRLFSGRNESASPRTSYVRDVRHHMGAVAAATSKRAITVTGDWSGNGVDDVLFYQRATGRTAVYELRADGSLGRVINNYVLAPRWSHIVAGDWDGDGDDELTFYRSRDGVFVTYQMRADGWLGERTAYRTLNLSWGNLVAGDWNGSGRDQLLFHRNNDGRYSSYTMTRQGDLRRMTARTNLRYKWATLVAGDWDGSGRDQLTLHRNSDGRFSSYTMTPDGYLGNWTAHQTLRSKWNVMQSTDQRGNRRDEYLLFRSTGDVGHMSTYNSFPNGTLHSNINIYRFP